MVYWSGFFPFRVMGPGPLEVGVLWCFLMRSNLCVILLNFIQYRNSADLDFCDMLMFSAGINTTYHCSLVCPCSHSSVARLHYVATTMDRRFFFILGGNIIHTIWRGMEFSFGLNIDKQEHCGCISIIQYNKMNYVLSKIFVYQSGMTYPLFNWAIHTY